MRLLYEADVSVVDESDKSKAEAVTFWRRYFYVHAAVVFWLIFVPLAVPEPESEALADFIKSTYFFTVALTYPLVVIFPMWTIGLLVVSRLRPNRFLWLAMLDAVLCVAHYLVIWVLSID